MPAKLKWCQHCLDFLPAKHECKKSKLKPADPLEKVIEQRVCDHAKALGMLCYKFTSPARRSVPDRLFIPKDRAPFLIEFKRKGQLPTEAQKVEITKIREQGTQVFVIDNIEDGKALIRDIELGADCQHQPEFGSGYYLKFRPVKTILDEY